MMANNLYKKQIRPIVWQNNTRINVPGISSIGWVDADYEDVKRDIWDKAVNEMYTDASLEIEEAYIPVELPQPTILDTKPGQIVCFQFNLDDWDVKTMCDYMEMYEKILPDTIGIALMPNIDAKVMDKKTAYAFIEEMKKRVDAVKDDIGNT